MSMRDELYEMWGDDLGRPSAGQKQRPLGEAGNAPGATYRRGNNRYFKDESGRVGRVYTPEDVSRQGGYTPRPGQLSRFETQQGDPLGSMEQVASEINANNPEKMAWVDRGRILQKTGQLERMMKANGGVSGLRQTDARMQTARQLGRLQLTSFGRAKQRQMYLGQAGMAATYRKALMQGDTKRANTVAAQLYRTGADPALLTSISQEVSGSIKGSNPLSALHPEQAQQLKSQYEGILARGDPSEMYTFALSLEAQGYHKLADSVRNSTGTIMSAFKSEEVQRGLAERALVDQDLAERKFTASQDNEGFDRFVDLQRLGQKDATIDMQFSRDENARKLGAAAAARDERRVHEYELSGQEARTRAVRTAGAKRYDDVVAELQKYRRDRGYTDAGSEPLDSQAVKLSVWQAVDEADRGRFGEIYDRIVKSGADPIQAAVFALDALVRSDGAAPGQQPQSSAPSGGLDPNDPDNYR